MESVASTKDLKVKVTYRQILSIALPITFAILVPQINLLTNSIFLGQLNLESLGHAGITGVFYLVFAVIGHGLNNGMQSVFSRYAGSGNPQEFKIILTQGIRLSLQYALAGILFTWLIAPYILQQVADPVAYPKEISFLKIRIWGLPFLYLFQMGNAFLVASLNSKLLVIGFIAETLVNILLDYLLIFGNWGFPQLGFNGAAVASVAAEFTGFAVVLIVLITTGLKKEYHLLQNFKYHRQRSKEVVRIATPLVLQFVISVTTWLIFFFLIEALHNDVAKAISNTMRNIFGLAGVFVWAFSGTCNTMVSNLIGQGKYDKVQLAIGKIMLLSICSAVGMALFMNLFPHLFFSLFGQGEEFINAATPVMRMVTAGILMMSMGNIWLNGVTGTGKTRVNLAIELVAITIYLAYTWYVMRYNYTTLAMGWSNELVYWASIFIMAFSFFKWGKWRETAVEKPTA
jgi:multidrug resistance protein, MATE family